MLSKIVQESVEKFELLSENYTTDIFHGKEIHNGVEADILSTEGNEQLVSAFISSQISLLEAELLRKQKIGIIYHTRNVYQSDGYIEAIQEDITYLTEQIELIKKMV